MNFPRTHLLAVLGLSLGLCSLVVAKLNDSTQSDRFTTEAVLKDLPMAAAESIQADAVLAVESDSRPQPSPTTSNLINPIAATWQRFSTKVAPGDNLALIFKRHGLSPREVHQVSVSKPLGKRLKQIYPGHELVFHLDEENQLMRLEYATGPLDRLEFNRTAEGFTSQQITQEPERVLAYKHGTIDHSLFIASQRAGLPDAMTMRLAQIFQWDIDFVLDIRPGDEFFVLFEELYHNEEFVGYGRILAAEFINQKQNYQAIAFDRGGGQLDYFTPAGESMRKAFLRAPVEFSRISSNFNLRRVHPLFKTVRPHRGIDYAAPQGTPILAAGDGKVTTASKTTANGNFVVIQHGEQFVTKYLHLSKFGRGVKRGARVQQGQVIGYVGATGWATAPHLHYEFLVNGVHENPRTVSLPNAAPIPKTDMALFTAQTQEYVALLDSYKSQISLALAR